MSEARLGVDIYIDHFETNNVQINARNDFKVVSGRSNLAQAIYSRLKTARGELRFHPEYGSRLHLLIGQSASDFTLSLAKQHAREALLQEPRIRRIDRIIANYADATKTTINIKITVTPIDADEPLNIVFPLFLQ